MYEIFVYGFLVSKKDFSKTEKNNIIWINVLCYENNLVYPVHILDKKFENCILNVMW